MVTATWEYSNTGPVEGRSRGPSNTWQDTRRVRGHSIREVDGMCQNCFFPSQNSWSERWLLVTQCWYPDATVTVVIIYIGRINVKHFPSLFTKNAEFGNTDRVEKNGHQRLTMCDLPKVTDRDMVEPELDFKVSSMCCLQDLPSSINIGERVLTKTQPHERWSSHKRHVGIGKNCGSYLISLWRNQLQEGEAICPKSIQEANLWASQD